MDILLSTTSVIEGRPVSRYLGVVTGEAIIGANIFRDMFAAVRDVVGGRSATYEKGLNEAREVAMAEMSQKAVSLGANAVIAIDIDYEVLGQGNGMLMVAVSGTAVVCCSSPGLAGPCLLFPVRDEDVGLVGQLRVPVGREHELRPVG